MTPEEMQARILELTDQNKNLSADLDVAKTRAAELEAAEKAAQKRITDLQEHNMKLFERIAVEPLEKPEEKPEKTIEEFALEFKV